MRKLITILLLAALTAVNVSAQGIFRKGNDQQAKAVVYQGANAECITFKANQSKFHLYPYHDDGKTAIVVRIRSERHVFNPEPVLKLTAADGSEIQLTGLNAGKIGRPCGIWISCALFTWRDLQYALFPIDDDQLAFFEKQIKTISINTLPSISSGKASTNPAFQKALLDGAE